MSEKSRLLSDPPPKSPILGDFEGGLVQKSPILGGWGVRIFDTSHTSSNVPDARSPQVFRELSPNQTYYDAYTDWLPLVRA